VIAAHGLPVQVACRVLGVSESGFYERRTRPPSERTVRHAMLTDLITHIHAECHGIYGARRVHAELTHGRGVQVGHNQVELLMRPCRRAGHHRTASVEADQARQHRYRLRRARFRPQRPEPVVGHRHP
jgi:hypothetical protein